MKRKININILITVIIAVILISITMFAINKETDKLSKMEPPVIHVGQDGEVLENFTKEDAVIAMNDVLSSIDKDVEGEERTLEERVEFMDNEKADLEDTISQDTIDRLYLEEEFSKDEFNRQFIASALLTFRKITEDISDDNLDLVSESLDELVYLDNKLLVAHIPIDVFTGDNKGFAFEMQYIDGEWKFNPYTSMMALVMIINYEDTIESLLKSEK